MLLARHDDVDLLVLDVDAGRAARVAERAGAEGRGLDAHAGGLASVLEGVAAVAACLPYRLNLEVMEPRWRPGATTRTSGGCTTSPSNNGSSTPGSARRACPP